MKKLLVILVLACVAPAMAANVTASSPNPGEILLTADAGIVGIALTVDGVSVSNVTVDSFFDVFIDSMYTNAGYVIGQGIPTALQTGPGELALPQSSFSISVGGLDDDGIGTGVEAPTSVLITLEGAAGSVTVDEDTLRGGIVGYDGAMVITGLPLIVNIGPAGPCGGGESASFITQWDLIAASPIGAPTGWCAPRQCRGDANNAVEGKNFYYASTVDLGIMLAAWNKPIASITDPTWINADFDRLPEGKNNYRVSTVDLGILLANWNRNVNTQPPAACASVTGLQ